MDKYSFFKKVKPDTYIWCTTMQTSIKFKDEVWIGVISAHTVMGSSSEVFFGNIFVNSESWGVRATSDKIEFEVWEDAQTEGYRYATINSIPSNCKGILYKDIEHVI